jgi:hypothetical protein
VPEEAENDFQHHKTGIERDAYRERSAEARGRVTVAARAVVMVMTIVMIMVVVIVIVAHEPPKALYFPFARNRAKAFNVASEAWCSMPSASASAASSGTPTACRSSTIRRCRARTRSASACPASVRKMPR